MASTLKRTLRVIPLFSKRGGKYMEKKICRVIPFFPKRIGKYVARNFFLSLRGLIKEQKKELLGNIADKYPSWLLRGMEMFFVLSSDFRKNIENFEGRYVFRTVKGDFEYSVIFKNGNMHVLEQALKEWDLKITFLDPGGLKAFLFSEDQDMLNSILENKVWTDGNLNYLFKFGFMARELVQKVCEA